VEVTQVRVTCLKPVESNTGIGDCDGVAQNVPEGVTDRHTDI